MRQGKEPAGAGIMPSVLDKELSDLSKDAFGHQDFANALGNLIEGPHQPPFSIGLLGSWGTGKSTIKELYLASLALDTNGPKRKKRKDRFHTITFNAWRYGGDEDIKRALLRHVFLQLGGDDVELRRNLYQQVTETSQGKRGFWEWLNEAVLQNATSALLFLLIFAAIMVIMWIVSYNLGLSDQWGLAAILTVGGAVAVFLSKYVVDIRLKSPTLFNDQTVISFPATSAEQYEQLLLDQIAKFRASHEGRTCERLVVFVDDLDRLSAAEMVSGLDAVRTFLELPLGKTSENFGVIFVISCDEDRVADALSRGRGRVNLDLPGSVFTRSDARRYLDRLFQFRLEIPPFPKLDMRQFTEKKLRESSSLVSEIEKRDVRLQDVVERLIHVGVQSPRNAIQILNAFTQTWWIAVQRERNGGGSSAPGVLYKGAVSDHPLALAALCVLRVDFPDFYNELQKRPELILEFNRVVFKQEAFDSLAVGAQHALKTFLIVQDEKGGRGKNDILPEYRNLRQYMSSLLDLRWPKSLQPLLLLAQDAISKKYGDRAAELHDAFVSGDTQGVLEIFGHHLDGDDLDQEDIDLLEELAEGLSDDTQTRRVNAARVLADIADRIPAHSRYGLMVPLARQMIDLKDIRTNVGPTAAKEIIASLAAADRREVADRFSVDLLSGQKLEWWLPSGETPNLEELVSDAKAAAELVLDVRASHGLPPATDVRLKAWLLGREVQSSHGAQTLSFAQLEIWMDQHAEHLLQLLDDEYTRLCVDELGSNPTAIPNKERMLQRMSRVFRRLAEGGQESRETLWLQVTSLVGVHDPAGAATAWIEAGTHAALAMDQQAQNFLLAMANRLHQNMEGDEEWELDWQAGAQQFLDLVTRWEEHVDQKTASGILPLAQSWAEDDATSAYMSRIASVLLRKHKEIWNSLIENLTDRPFGDLPWPSLEYIGKNIKDLKDEHKSTLKDHMNSLVNSDPVDADHAEKYKRFIAVVPQAEWSSPPLLVHTKTSLARLSAMPTNADYLSAIFPAARLLFGSAPNGQISTVLQPLFEQAAGSPNAYPILHREMAGNWPEENEQTGPYNPSAIASRAIQFIKENPSLPGSGDVFKSVVDMVSRGIIEDVMRTQVSDAAKYIWPHSPDSVVECVNQIAAYISPRDARKILTVKQGNDLDVEAIQAIAGALSLNGDHERCLDITKELLAIAPQQIADQPDGALTIWLSSLGEKELGVLVTLIEDGDLNEAQRERVLTYAIAKRQHLGFSFFAHTAPIVLTRPEEAKPLRVLVTRMDDIVSLADSSDLRSLLVAALVPTLPSLSGEPLATVSRSINKLNGKGTLERSSEVLEKMDADQLTILSNAIPASKIIQGYLKSALDAPAQ